MSNSQLPETKSEANIEHPPRTHNIEITLNSDSSTQKKNIHINTAGPSMYQVSPKSYDNMASKPTIEKPLIVKKDPTKGAKLSFQKSTGEELKIQPKEVIQPQESAPTIPVISKSSRDIVSINSDEYSVDFLRKIGDKVRESKQSAQFGRNSRGYITLSNLIANKEAGGDQHHGKQNQRQNYYSKNVELTHKTGDAFIPVHQLKTVDMYDEESDEAIHSSIRQLLNRLTQATLTQTLTEIKEIAKTPELIAFTADIFCTKASQEINFASLYADFTYKTYSSLKDGITSTIMQQFFDWQANPTKSEYDSQIASGCSKFLASLVKLEVLPFSSGKLAINALFKSLENCESSIIEMLYSFVEAAGANFIKRVPKENWDKITKTMKSNIPSRIKFLLQDILEKRDEWIRGIVPSRSTTPQIPQPDQILSDVRSAYSDYSENDSVVPELKCKVTDFYNAAMTIFTDQTKEPNFYCYFVALELAKFRPEKSFIVKQLKDTIQKFVADEVVRDFPKIWTNVTLLLLNCVLVSVINAEDAKTIHATIPESPPFDIVNEMKWFLDCYHYFIDPVEIYEFPSYEIVEALRMPKTIMQDYKSIRMSRLMAVATVRSVLAKFRLLTEHTVNNLEKWKPFLCLAYSKQQKAFTESLIAEIDETGEFKFSSEDVINYCKNK